MKYIMICEIEAKDSDDIIGIKEKVGEVADCRVLRILPGEGLNESERSRINELQ